MLCLAAVKTLKDYNYHFFINLVNTKKLQELYSVVYDLCAKKGITVIYDGIGCCSRLILKNTASHYTEKSTVFIIEDSYIQRIIGIYIQESGHYLVSTDKKFRNCNFNYINVCNYYYNSDIRQQHTDRCNELEQIWLYKRGGIDKPGNL